MKYFDEQDLLELMQFDEKEAQSKTLELIESKHPFQVHDTPTLSTHIPFLKDLELVEGVTNHQSLFSKDEDEEAVEDQEELIAQRFKDFQMPSQARKSQMKALFLGSK